MPGGQGGPRFPGFGVGRGFAIWGPFRCTHRILTETWTSLNKNLACTLPLLAEFEILALQASTRHRLHHFPAQFSTESINSGEEPLGQQTCTIGRYQPPWFTETAEIWEEASFLLSTTDRPVRTGSAKLYR